MFLCQNRLFKISVKWSLRLILVSSFFYERHIVRNNKKMGIFTKIKIQQ